MPSVVYNDKQLEAINSNHNKILVLACAGAGKSTTLVSRAARLIQDGVDPSSILCLTFTNKAGSEMSEKFKRVFPKIAPVPEFRTFHAFCYSLIVRDRDVRAAIGYDKIPGIASDALVKEARETATLQTKISLSDDILTGKVPCPPRERYKLETWQKAYRKYLARLDVITFDIMADEVGALFVKNSDVVDKYKKKYKHIMVDEFQDTDKKQFRFVASFKDANWFFVGDALQCQPAGSMVLMADGTEKDIKDIVVGDEIMSCDIETDEYSPKEVLRVESHMEDYGLQTMMIEDQKQSCYSDNHLCYVRRHITSLSDPDIDVSYVFEDDGGVKHNVSISDMKIHAIPASLVCEEHEAVVPILDESGKYHSTYKRITNITETDLMREGYKVEVFSLSIADNHNYISDGILTHNCIYQFRGTSNQFIKMLSEDDEWLKIRMDQNYRSTKEICNFANDMSHYAKDTYRLELKSKKEGLKVSVKTGGYTNFNNPIDGNHMKDIIKNLAVCRETSGAILCRTNNEVRAVVNYLSKSGVACTSSKKYGMIIPIIKAAGDLAYELEYLASILTKDNYNSWIKVCYAQEANLNDFLEMFKTNSDVKRIHNKVEKVREILNTGTDAKSKANMILSKFSIVGVNCDPEYDTISSIVSSLVDAINSFQEASLYVGTIHSVKGLEYDTVFILGVDQGVWSLDCEDNLNLYYVAITRAKNHLFVYKA